MPVPDTSGQQQRALIAWRDLLDGRVRRLKRGVHYTGTIDVIAREAKVAGERLGKHAATFKDQMGKSEYLWVQFLDGKLNPGEPCLICGHTELERVQEYFARCLNCDSLHALAETPPGTADPETGDEVFSRPQFAGLRLLSADGDEVEEVNVLEETTIEIACRFPSPVARADAQLLLFHDGVRVLRADYPAKLVVTEPGVVRFAFHMGANVLHAGEYSALASMRARLRDEDEQAVKLVMPPAHALEFRAVDPRDSDPAEPEPEPASLRWSVTPGYEAINRW